MAATTIPHAPREAGFSHLHPEPQSFVRKYLFSIDHKIIGIQYFVTSLVFLALGGLLAELIRVQLMHASGGFLSADTYNEVYTAHGTVMVWMVIIPLLTGGFGNYVMPLMLGQRDVAFPWLNMVAFWTFPLAGLLFFSSFLFGAPAAGWVEYPPMSLQGGIGTTIWCASVWLLAFSTTLTSVNFLATMLLMRPRGMTLTRMPLLIWAQLITAAMSLIATSALMAAVSALFLERVFGVPFFDPAQGGSPLLWQHMFWFYSHPAVYLMIVPAFGIVSEIYPTFARKPLFGYRLVAFSTVAIGVLSFLVWAHHMFTSGLAPYMQLPFMIVTMIIAIPTGVKIFAWLATLFGGKIRFTTPMLFAIGFIGTFTIGGISGVFLAAVPFDLHAHGTYFIVAHIHYVLFGGSMFAIFAGLYYWYPKITGRLMSERLGKWHFWLTMLAFNGTFLPMHWLGLLGMPRRIAAYDPQFQAWNDVASVASFLLAGATLLLFWNLLWSAKHGKPVSSNPWGARTLEWQIPSPPPYYNFERPVTVYGLPYDFAEPLPYGGV
ncbi:MAG: cytochrome c oxidase subunit I [Vulcanimicrobiaceae bacterium]